MKTLLSGPQSGRSLFRKLSLLVLLASSALSLQAEDVFVVGFKGLASGATDAMPCPPTCTSGATFFPAGGAGVASASQVSPVPVVPNSARKIYYGIAANASISFTPTDLTISPAAGGAVYNFTALKNIGVYKIYLTKGQDNNASSDIVVQMTATGGSLADSNGVASAGVDLTMFQKGKPNHVWVHVGYITNDTLSPTITLTHVGGLIDNLDANNNNAHRWYTDAIRFEYLDSCAGVATQVTVNGPLVQGQSFVNVSGIVAGATNVTVYAGGSLIGETNRPAGFAAGNLTVATTRALIKGDSITAGQIKNGCVSAVPSSGPITGSGPNVSVKALISLYRDPNFAGPVGANAPTNLLASPYFLKANGFVAGFGTAPNGGEVLTPSGCWQTLTFDHSVDPLISFNGASAAPNTDPFAAFQGLVFALNELDSGFYNVYVDRIMNGDTVIENFEGYTPGTSATFRAPNLATSPTPTATYLSTPNSSLITQSNVFDGTNALQVQWQWLDENTVRWAHIPANNTNAGKFYPQIDVTKPITVRYLVLPAGQTNASFKLSTVANQSVAEGATATFTVTPTGTGPFTFAWKKNGDNIADGGNISGATTQTLSVSGVSAADVGSYSVVVTGACSMESNAATLAIGAQTPPTLTVNRSGNDVVISWSGNGFVLQESSTVDGTYQTIGGAGNPYTTNASSGTKFYRLRSNP